MTIVVCGDPHGELCNFVSDEITREFQDEPKNAEKFTLFVGDAGLVWNENHRPQRIKAENDRNKLISLMPWTTLFIDGNHENFERLNQLPTVRMFGNDVGVVHKHIYHLRRGRVYIINGKKIWCYGGGRSIDAEWRIKDMYHGGDRCWWPEEETNSKEMNRGVDELTAHNWEVDYVVTHEVPEVIKYKLFNPIAGVKRSEDKNVYVTSHESYFEEIRKRLKFRVWYAGHYHVDEVYNDELGNTYHILMYNRAKIF